eukprot:6189991-Pleurochrysis_carterae.AAC.1
MVCSYDRARTFARMRTRARMRVRDCVLTSECAQALKIDALLVATERIECIGPSAFQHAWLNCACRSKSSTCAVLNNKFYIGHPANFSPFHFVLSERVRSPPWQNVGAKVDPERHHPDRAGGTQIIVESREL